MTQEELAEYMGVSRQSVSKWETGDAYPETDKLIVLSDLFGMSLDELVRGNADMQINKMDGMIENDVAEKERKEANVHTEVEKNVYRLKKIGDAICGVIMLSVTAVYLVLGIAFGLWHPLWIMFPVCGTVCLIIYLVTQKRKELKKKLCGIIMMSVAAIYLIIGFVWGFWHPGWIVFPVGGIICAIINLITDVKDDNGKDE